ncbi:MAG: hypothetical protein EXR43_05300 [Dehalococcoidia bacterium]|nr:hypothetical protein [Dehalococcoidia bacterium]
MELPDIVLVGHMTRDLLPEGDRPGGSVVYGAHLAARWGYRPAVFTATANAAEARRALPLETLLHIVPSDATTTFRNKGAHPRRQQVSAFAAPLVAQALPPRWREAPVFLLAPVIGEIGPNFLRDAAPTGITGVCLQGWLRATDQEGTVHPIDAATLDLLAILPLATAVFLSDEDLAGTADPEAFLHALCCSTYVLLTRGEGGVRLLTLDAPYDLPALPARPVDTTGAGDVFATAFLLSLAAHETPLDATMLAQAASARAIEGAGVSAIPTLEQAHRTLAGAA